jgi:hypothetical protein
MRWPGRVRLSPPIPKPGHSPIENFVYGVVCDVAREGIGTGLELEIESEVVAELEVVDILLGQEVEFVERGEPEEPG